MKSEKKFLVTGPTGATGGETVEQLLQEGTLRPSTCSPGGLKIGTTQQIGRRGRFWRPSRHGIGTFRPSWNLRSVFRLSDSTGDRGCNCSIC